MWETPRASFIPAQGNALGSSAQNPISAESAIHPSSYQPPATRRQWFQLLFLGLIPMKSQASTNSVLRPCPRSEKSKMRTFVRISDFSKTTTRGNWSADILVRSRTSVNPEADRNVCAGAGQNSSRAISHQGLAEVKGGRCDRWETPRASFIPAQGNALGSSAPKPISAESAIHPSSYQPPASHSASVPNVSFIELYEAGRWPATEYLLDDEPRALPWAGMKQAFGLSRGHPPGEHPSHRNPFFIREIRGSNSCF